MRSVILVGRSSAGYGGTCIAQASKDRVVRAFALSGR